MTVDFWPIDARHEEVHRRLEEWAKWCEPGRRAAVCPMFRQMKQIRTFSASESRSINPKAAHDVEKAIQKLPSTQAMALRWWYVWRWSPGQAARRFGVTLEALCQAVEDGRDGLADVLA